MPTTFRKITAFARRMAPTVLTRSMKADSLVIMAGDEAAKVLYRRPTREDVFNAWRFILGRDPSEDQVESLMRERTVAAVRRILIRCAEFRGLFLLENLQANAHPDNERGRPTVVYIHLLKTGGTSLRVAIDAHFPLERICPVHFNELHNLSVAELGRYDFFKGHFDCSSIRFIPRDDIKVISMFRDPRARLISTYRSLRAAPVESEYDIDSVALANRLTIEEFFEHPEIRALADIHNYYLMTFGCSPSGVGQKDRPSLSQSERSIAMDAAKRNIGRLAALGITEEFDRSARLICKVLDIPVPGSVAALNVTDNMPSVDPRFKKVEPIAMSDRLAEALEELTESDHELYQFALDEFERRCAEEKIK